MISLQIGGLDLALEVPHKAPRIEPSEEYSHYPGVRPMRGVEIAET